MSVPRRSSTRLAIIAMLIAAASIALLGIIHVHNRHEIIHLGYKLTKANAKLRRLQEDNRRLRLEKSVLTNPARIQRLTKHRGMRPPAMGQVRVISVPPELARAEKQHGNTRKR